MVLDKIYITVDMFTACDKLDNPLRLMHGMVWNKRDTYAGIVYIYDAMTDT